MAVPAAPKTEAFIKQVVRGFVAKVAAIDAPEGDGEAESLPELPGAPELPASVAGRRFLKRREDAP